MLISQTIYLSSIIKQAAKNFICGKHACKLNLKRSSKYSGKRKSPASLHQGTVFELKVNREFTRLMLQYILASIQKRKNLLTFDKTIQYCIQ